MFGGTHGISRAMGRDTLKPKRVGETLRRFGAYFRPYWALLILVGVLLIASTWAQVAAPRLIGQLVDCYLTPTAVTAFGNLPFALEGGVASGAVNNCTMESDPAVLNNAERLAGLGMVTLMLVGLYLMNAVLTGLTVYLMNWSGQHVLRQFRVDLFKHLHHLSLGFYSKEEAGDLMSRITNDTDTIQQVFNFGLVGVLSSALLLVWVVFSMFQESVVYALVSLSVLPFMILTTLWFSSQARKAFRKTRLEMGSVNAELQETISAVREVQAFSREQDNIDSFMITNAANRDANIRAVSFTSALGPTLEAFGYLSLAIVAGVGGILLLRGQPLFGTVMSLGLVITFLNYVQRFNQPIQQISVMWTNIQSAVAGGERIFGLLDEEPAIEDMPEAQKMPKIIGKVELQNVFAAYKEEESVLNGISFEAEPGQTIAIVGPTGAGKTTLVNLIPRFYDVTGGTLLIDGLDIRFVTKESLREQIGIVLQDTFLFSTSVMENIRFGRPDASDKEVIEAAKLAHADAFIEQLPDGYQTELGERGSGISQGQRQLISIARAALSDPQILILDEATSSVDTRTERLIQKALENLLKDRTSFVIAHRLSTIRNADLLLVLNEGKIVERGKHEELLDKKGSYYDLYMSQFRRAEQEPIVSDRASQEFAVAQD
ncbi:MAG: ABC transporter ATP-binding protein [Chloroflexota bacterium]|nr:MAG: ABC transporter ATP-binding protein [Chloroflexota bacterium]